MTSFDTLLFTEAVRALQEEDGSRDRMEASYRNRNTTKLGPDESAFIESRTSIYIATVNPDGWPYVQHRGGPAGFVRVLDDNRLAFLDYPGNRQFISTGNVRDNDKISLFMMDYPRRARLKILGHATMKPIDSDPDVASRLATSIPVEPERINIVDVVAFDWNCPKYILPRFTEAEMEQMLAPRFNAMQSRLASMEKLLRENGLSLEEKNL